MSERKRKKAPFLPIGETWNKYMLSLIGTIVGFISSVLPAIVDLFRAKQEQKYELEKLRLLREIELDKTNSEALKAIYEHDSKLDSGGDESGNKWIEGLRASVRPVVTYLFLLLFLSIKLISAWDLGWSFALDLLWDEETQVLFAAIISFWFGSRAMHRLLRP